MTALPQAGMARSMRGMNPLYPCSDGKPMADNDTQRLWIETLEGGLADLFRDRADVYVTADVLVYPVEGRPDICTAPDVFVVFGRPKENRGSYIVHEEDGVFPQVVFEVLSPSNRPLDMQRKRQFYRRYGAEEFYVYDPDGHALEVWLRDGTRLVEVDNPDGFVSPRLGVRFDLSGGEMAVYGPDGQRFLTRAELKANSAQAEQRAEEAERRAEEAERQAATAERERDRLRAALRAAGLDPDALPQ